MTSDLISITLSAAVPLWIEQLKDKPLAHVRERAGICGQVIAEHGDDILFRSRRKGASAEAFNRLAEGLACLALLVPGGVTAFGLHFEADHPKG